MNILLPLGLYLLALLIRLVAAEQIPFPTTEPSAYYADVARNLVDGAGLVSNGVWSYATPPLVVPKPAFELWLPMSSFVSAAPMAVLGTGFGAAQLGGALLGALVAPLAWVIGRESARTSSLDARRAGAVAIASGLLASVLSPLVLGSVVPDSYIPFTVFILIAAVLAPRVLGIRDGVPATPARPSILAGLSLGIAMGLAYLSRQEVIWFGLTVVLMTWWVVRASPPGGRFRQGISRLWPVVLGGLIVVLPWLVRNYIDLDSFFPGQAVENMFLIDNEDIFAFSERPDAQRYLAQGAATLIWNPIAAAWDTFTNVLAFTAFPVGIAGLVALVGMRHSAALRRPTALVAVLISSAFTVVTTILLFPVATLWGTFMHASGPLLVALIVLSALGGDALLARISVARGWEKPNVILGPIALIAMAGLLGVFQLQVFSTQSKETMQTYDSVAAGVAALADREGIAVPATVISDHPMWVADALGSYGIALPDEDLPSILALSRAFDAPWLIVVDERGRYPEALLGQPAEPCLAGEPVALTNEEEPAWLFRLDANCGDV
jgi:hypothetical protein